MTSEAQGEFYEYRDTELSVRVPSYLHNKRRMRFFEGRSKKEKTRPLFAFGIELRDDYGAIVQRDIMMRMVPGSTGEQQGFRGNTIRRGKVAYLADGLEMLGTSCNIANRKLYCYYNVLFALAGHHIYAMFLGQDELREFEGLCKKIVLSVRLVRAGEVPVPAPRSRFAGGGLGRADTKRLKGVLDGLPAEIAYLRRPILAIAKQDQDLLGSGEANTGPMEQWLRKAAKGGASARMATAHADALHQWLVALGDCDGVWAAPIAFVEGFLRGYAQFGAEPP